MSVNKYNGTDLIRIAGKGAKGDMPDIEPLEQAITKVIQDSFEVITPTFSALPVTFTVPGMTADHQLILDGYVYLSNESACLNEWTLTTGTNTLTISGSISGSTYLVATLGIKRTVNATSS